MTDVASDAKRRFYVELIKPSRYDDDGYVVQWRRTWVPSNTLACLYGLTLDAADRHVLGDDVQIVPHAYDECSTVIPVKRIIRRIKAAGGRGVVCLVGVQTNQYPRAVDIARSFRRADIPVVIGGFHVSGSIAMLPEMPEDLKQALDLGITLFAGEAEGRLGGLFADAYHGQLQGVYNFLGDPPDLRGRPLPILPERVLRKCAGSAATIDAGRGCPFNCTFCTIINVQGRKSRHRSADDVEKLVRAYHALGVKRFFIVDDNFARNRNWEAILDRLIDLKEHEGIKLRFLIQIDAQAYKIPRFVEKAARAGCKWVFIGIESVSPENLKAANKRHSHIDEVRAMLQGWHDARILTQAGYMLGFPADTPESIERDIGVLQDLPVDLVKFACLIPLPGSVDHREMVLRGEWLDPDLNRYTGEKAVMRHPSMSKRQWEDVFRRSWRIFYTYEHLGTMLRRAEAGGPSSIRLLTQFIKDCLSFAYEGVQPLEGGYVRRKVRTHRRPGFPRENPLVFYPRRVWETVAAYVPAVLQGCRMAGLRNRIRRDARARRSSR